MTVRYLALLLLASCGESPTYTTPDGFDVYLRDGLYVSPNDIDQAARLSLADYLTTFPGPVPSNPPSITIQRGEILCSVDAVGCYVPDDNRVVWRWLDSRSCPYRWRTLTHELWHWMDEIRGVRDPTHERGILWAVQGAETTWDVADAVCPD